MNMRQMNSKKSLHGFLGLKGDTILSESPFDGYHFNITVEKDLSNDLYIYTCEAHGFEFQCNDHGYITTIFITKNSDLMNTHLLEIECDWSIDEVRRSFGKPSKYGKSWDRFDFKEYAFHVSYDKDNMIEMVTLMHRDVIPQG